MGEFNEGGRRGFGRGGGGGGGGGFGRGGGGGGFGRSFGPREPREEHKAVCSECGKECTVPFPPKEGRPVYCTECYRKRRGF